MAFYDEYAWLMGLISVFFVMSCLGNGANDVANSYATAVASRTMTLPMAAILAMFTEFFGAVVLGSRVTATIKGNIIDITHFEPNPAVLILVMTCAEFASGTWLLVATWFGFPVSTTQTIVGAMVGVGLASGAAVTWRWTKGSVSQIAASWFIAPVIAAIISAIIYMTIKLSVLLRKDPLKWALRLIPFYIAFTGGVLAFFVVVEEADGLSTLETAGIIIGVFVVCMIFSYVFFSPYIHRRLIKQDTRLRYYHIPLGPLLWMEDPPIYYPSRSGNIVDDYYSRVENDDTENHVVEQSGNLKGHDEKADLDTEAPSTNVAISTDLVRKETKKYVHPRERFLGPTAHLPIYYPSRLWAWCKFCFLQGITRDVLVHKTSEIEAYKEVQVFDNKVEHLWTYTQTASSMIMSVAHGSNDVANALGPWVGAYNVYITGEIEPNAPTPVWIIVIAGLLLGVGFWVIGYKIVRAMGTNITMVSPTRGYSMEVGTTITILFASYLGIPVSTTMCKTGATVGVALMNGTVRAVNWRQVAWIFSGWVYTLPVSGCVAGLIAVMALNSPQF